MAKKKFGETFISFETLRRQLSKPKESLKKRIRKSKTFT